MKLMSVLILSKGGSSVNAFSSNRCQGLSILKLSYLVRLFERPWVKWGYVVVVFVGLLSVFGELLNGLNGANWFSDDAYYYILTARNYVEEGFFTFDKINETNGFHPLWMFVLLLVYKIVGTDLPLNRQVFYIKGTEILIFVLILFSVAYMSYRLRQKNPSYSWAFAGLALVFVLPRANLMFLKGMETTIATFFLLWVYYTVINDEVGMLSWLLPFLFLSRLDTLVFVAGPVLLYYLSRRDVVFYRKAIVSLPVITTSVLVMGHNYIRFGYLRPVSGLLKSSFPVPSVQLSHLADPVLYAFVSGSCERLLLMPNVLNLTLLIIGASAFLVKQAKQVGKAEGSKSLLFAAIPVLLILNLLVFQKWRKGIESWYMVLPTVTTLFVAFLALQRIGENRGLQWLFYLGAAVSLVTSATFHVARLPSVLSRRHYINPATLYIIDNTDPEAILAGTDVGGRAFWSDRRIINLDGVTNNYQYQEVIKNRQLRKYLEDNDVRYLLVGVWSDKPRFQLRENEYMYTHRVDPEAVYEEEYRHEYFVYSYMFNAYSDRIVLTSEQAVYRSAIGVDGLNDVRMIIFDITQ